MLAQHRLLIMAVLALVLVVAAGCGMIPINPPTPTPLPPTPLPPTSTPVPPTPTLDIRTQVAQALSVMQTATALVPTPTATPTPTRTATPTATPTRTAMATPTPTLAPSGKEHRVGEFSLWLPPKWEPWQITLQTLQSVIDAMKQASPQFAKSMEAMLSDPQTLQSMKFFAYNAESGASLNVVTTTLPFPVPMDTLTMVITESLAAEGVTVVSIKTLDINGMDAVQVFCELTMEVSGAKLTVSEVAYLVMKGSRLYMLTFAADSKNFERLLPTFHQIATSFRVKD